VLRFPAGGIGNFRKERAVKPKKSQIVKHNRSPIKRALGSLIDDPTEDEIANNESITDNWTIASPENVEAHGWSKTFTDTWAALERGEDGARERLHTLTVMASTLLDHFLPSTLPGAMMDMPSTLPALGRLFFMVAVAQADMFRFAEQVNDIYSSINGKQSATTRRRKAEIEKPWQIKIRDEAVPLLTKSKMSAAQIADRLAHHAPAVKPNTIRKYLSKLKRELKGL
jgi:hypothetical protein